MNEVQRKPLGRRATPPSKPIGTLGVLAIAFGIGVVGAYAFDLHSHACSCGNKWRHLGAFNFGDQDAHTCKRCGQVQGWKGGGFVGTRADGAFQPMAPLPPPLPSPLLPHQIALSSKKAPYP